MCYFILTVSGILLLVVMMDDIRPSKEDLGKLSETRFKINDYNNVFTIFRIAFKVSQRHIQDVSEQEDLGSSSSICVSRHLQYFHHYRFL